MSAPPLSPDQLAHQKWCRIADRIEADPALLQIPIRNIERCSKTRTDGLSMLTRWKSLIDSSLTDKSEFLKLLTLLRSNSEDSLLLKYYSPFAGVLSSAEVDEFTCACRH